MAMLRLFAAMLGPVFAKEMVEMARRKRYYLNRILYGLVLLLTMAIVWKDHSYRINPNGTASIKGLAEFAQAMFRAVAILQYGAVYLFVPLFLCGVIASEREERTLDLLFTTALTDTQIVVGKLCSRIAAMVLLILCSLPVLSMIMLYGGIDPPALWRSLAATLLAILFVGAHAIYFSTVTKSPMGALVRTYWRLLLWLLLVPMFILIPLSAFPPLRRFEDYGVAGLVFTNPFAVFIISMDDFSYQRMIRLVGAWFFPLSMVLPAAWSVYLIGRAVWRLRLAPTTLALLIHRFAFIRRIREALRRRAEARLRRRHAKPEWFLGTIPVWNPLWLRARRVRVYDREGHISRIQLAAWLAAGCFLVLFAVVEHRALTHRGLNIPFLALTWIGAAALAGILAATSLVGDRRRGFLELILLTPLEPRAVFDGTLLAVWQHWRRMWILAAVLTLLFWLMGAATGIGSVCSFVTASLFCALLMVYGITFSLMAQTMPGALVPTFVFLLMVNVATAFLIGAFEKASAPILWVITVTTLVVSRRAVRRRLTLGRVSCHLMAMHLALASLLTGWMIFDGEREMPLPAMHPAFLSMQPLVDQPQHWFRQLPWPVVYMCYWTALILNLLWARRWVIRHFDQIVERPTLPAALQARPRVVLVEQQRAVSPSELLVSARADQAAIPPE
jgi:ABC-type transport system involved in multi-copper enzyme maturation permease subunit